MALLAALLTASWAGGDDTKLLRVAASKPYVYIVLDTSSSMNLSSSLRASTQDPPVWVVAGADDPGSMFHEVRSVLAEVLDTAYRSHGEFAQFGFVGFDQNHLRVRGKHWRYAALEDGIDVGGTPYPAAGEELTFGAHLPTTADPGGLPMPVPGQLGSCQTPVSLAAARPALDHFPKLHPVDTDGDGSMELMEPTTLWLEDGGTTHELLVAGVDSGGLLGDGVLSVELTLSTWTGDCTAISDTDSTTISFALRREFLLHDRVDDGELGIGVGGTEADGGVWRHHDAAAVGRCGEAPHPHAGFGWEGNYDGGTLYGPPSQHSDVDPYCDPAAPEACGSLKHPTVLGPHTLDPGAPIEWRTLDAGDQIPWDWDVARYGEILRRLAPDWEPGKPPAELDFGVASYFEDVPNASGFLEPLDPARLPPVPFGASGLVETLTDWRCAYLGSDGGGPDCDPTAQPFGRGFDWLASIRDTEWGCRRPRLLVLTDGESNCSTADPSAVAPLLAEHGVAVWVANLGPAREGLRALAEATGGDYRETAGREELRVFLTEFVDSVLGESDVLATDAIATGSAAVRDRIFLSEFEPLTGASVWRGELHGFLKPVPLDSQGRPALDVECGAAPGSAPEAACLMWSAGTEILEQVTNDIGEQFGPLPGQRRVYYSRLAAPGAWPGARRYLAPTSPGMPEATVVRYDLWRGLGLLAADAADGSLDPAEEALLETRANGAIGEMMAPELDDNGTPEDPGDDSVFLLGDSHHARPLVVGPPANSRYFALDLADDGTPCTAGNPSYRCFFQRHQRRRSVALLASNDALLHAIDVGIPRASGPFAGETDRGTGHEVFAFAPRGVLPAVKALFGDGLSRTWAVDGPLTAADAFIDPLDDGGVFPDPAEREWRTVVVGGLRRGGDAYYALDLTQPDPYDPDGLPSGVDDYVPGCLDGGAGCGTLPYPAQLWEFTDSWLLSDPPREARFDSDLDGEDDLVSTWSVPSLGRMEVCAGANCDPTALDNDIESRGVAVFGGGLDKSNVTGNWLFIVDLETGRAIYKRELLDSDGASGGAVASGIAAVDTDDDGFLDRVYAPTLRGYLYRVDLRGPDGEVPRLAPAVELVDPGGGAPPIQVEVSRVTSDDFRPRVVFKAQPDSETTGPASRAIYHRPSVIFSAALDGHVLAFGTGDREDLWSGDGSRGAFYAFRDDIAADDFDTYYTEADLVAIDSELDGDHPEDLLTDPSLQTKGWHLRLGPDERLVADPIAVAGVLVFTVFAPQVEVDSDTLTCSYSGQARVFGVTATNADGLLFDDGDRRRSIALGGLPTAPWIESATSAAPPSETNGATADDLTPDQHLVLEELRKLLPANCRFANHRLDVKARSTDGRLDLLVPIPICIVEKSWKEL